MKCKICSSEKLTEINQAIADGFSSRYIGQKYGVNQASVLRHKGKCGKIPLNAIVTPTIIYEHAPASPSAQRYDAYDRMVSLARDSEDLLTAIKEKHPDDTYRLSMAMEQVRKNIEVMLKVYEAQQRIAVLYAKKEDPNASQVFRWLGTHYPEVLTELNEYIGRDIA